MPKETNQWTEAVTRLTALTQEGALKWSVNAFSDDVSRGLGPTFRTAYKYRNLRLHMRRSEADYYKSTGSVERVVLEFVDNNDNSLWEFPYTDALEDLYRAVQFQAADVKGFLDDLLSEV